MKKFLNRLLKLFLCVLVLISIIAGSYFASMRWLMVKHETAVFENLPENLDGLRMLHLSDLHSNSEKELYIDIWSSIEKEEFDIVCITGDLIINYLDEINPVLPGLEKLAKEKPVFFVDGNHEMYVYTEIKQLFEKIGIRVLNNEQVLTDIPGFGELSIVGIRDFYNLSVGDRMKAADAVMNKNSGHFNIVLSHQPQIIDRYKELDLGLVLSGHTHGGQVRIPFFPTLYAPSQGILPKYGDGWYNVGSNKLYISRGIGTTVFSVRLFNRPELAVITLKKAK